MAVRIVLDNPPEFYTNLDFVSGRVVLNLGRPETVGAVVVKLEGESRTALAPPLEDPDHHRRGTLPGGPGPLVSENHKLLYKVQQVYPDERAAAASSWWWASATSAIVWVIPSFATSTSAWSSSTTT